MPGLKRKASQSLASESPPKLKKQSTSAAVDKGVGKVTRKKEIPATPPKLKKADSQGSAKKATPKKSPGKPLKLPRFPTLKPSKTIGNDTCYSGHENQSKSFCQYCKRGYFCWGKNFAKNVGKTFHVGVIFTILLLFPL